MGGRDPAKKDRFSTREFVVKETSGHGHVLAGIDHSMKATDLRGQDLHRIPREVQYRFSTAVPLPIIV